MTGLIVFMIIIFVVFWIILIVMSVNVVNSHKRFINNAKKIELGMTKNDVISLMGEPTGKRISEDSSKYILLWQKSQWKGIAFGGTLIRSVRITFENDKVVSIEEDNLNKSLYF